MASKMYPLAFAISSVFLATSQFIWARSLHQHVPDPYLDEVFHGPQAQAYWHGRWSHWDPKITTPPGLYVFSWLVYRVRNIVTSLIDDQYPARVKLLTIDELRWSNGLLWWLILATLFVLARTGVARNSNTTTSAGTLDAVGIVTFPLFFFFSGLYYTDLFSAWTVLVTWVFWQAGQPMRGGKRSLFQLLHFISGLVSLASRQTNIFWVGVFLGGLQLVETVKANKNIYDPVMPDACLEDFLTTICSLLMSAIHLLPKLLLDLWPQLSLLLSFGTFIVWNGGVVLGDKSNHVATIHTPQMLYMWVFIVFFSWPKFLPLFSNLKTLRARLPRVWVVLAITVPMIAAVHLNTIVHPFTLADNRHYTFYVFRILRSKWWIKYAAVPVYFFCAWLCISALGIDYTAGREKVKSTRTATKLQATSRSGGSGLDVERRARVSFTLIWLVSSALSLITAPLVEPRYFMIPWLVWRLHVPSPNTRVDSPPSSPKHSRQGPRPRLLWEHVLNLLGQYSSCLEIFWHTSINLVTCWIFLNWRFGWAQEPGKVQRFMW